MPAMRAEPTRLADRVGMTYHRSPLLMRVRRLMAHYRTGASEPMGWLLDVANARGWRVVTRPNATGGGGGPGFVRFVE